MSGGEESGGREPGVVSTVYCIVPRALVRSLHARLERHFRDQPRIQVVAERRALERRSPSDRRTQAAPPPPTGERRRIRAQEGRRVGPRRSAALPVEPAQLPRGLRGYADQLVFVERVEPSSQHEEDLDTARLVTRFQAGDGDVFGELYMRYFDRVYGYLQIVLQDPHEAEDATQQAFIRALEGLPRYERRQQPFRFWLFTIVRNHALNELRKRNRLELQDPHELARIEPHVETVPDQLDALSWISDRDLLLFIERLPLAQRQVLVLRYMLDLSHAEIAELLGRTPVDVRSLQSRAVRFLRARLEAVGRLPSGRNRIRMRTCLRQAPVIRRRRFALTPR